MKNFENLNSLTALDAADLEEINGGIAPLVIFVGKAALSGIGFGLGYFGAKKIFGASAITAFAATAVGKLMD